MSQFTHFTIDFANQNKAYALRDVPPDADPQAVLDALQLPACNGIITLMVGAGSMPDDIREATRLLFTQGLAPVAEDLKLIVVDGGTHAGGIMAMGDARHAINGTFPLIGVCPLGAVTVPDVPPASWPLDPFHSHFVLVAGDAFGDECDLLPGLLRGRALPGAALLVNARTNSPLLPRELPLHARWADILIAVRHSGGAADALLDPDSDTHALLPANTRLEAVDLDAPDDLAGLLRHMFVHV